ncbi:glutathione S-transferase [Maricaulis sp.]|uniref:glutathione S-transferase n=1 Tax=Maricaulis sp. TaxID=1486257 RepID=UPI003A94216A
MNRRTSKDVINANCPWSGEPVSASALTRYRGHVVGFCNPGCRDRFEAATSLFDSRIEALAENDGRSG